MQFCVLPIAGPVPAL